MSALSLSLRDKKGLRWTVIDREKERAWQFGEPHFPDTIFYPICIKKWHFCFPIFLWMVFTKICGNGLGVAHLYMLYVLHRENFFCVSLTFKSHIHFVRVQLFYQAIEYLFNFHQIKYCNWLKTILVHCLWH